jgi:hypothetical protein
MPNTKRLAVVVAVPWLLSINACVSSSVQKGTLIGAASGALLGAGTGVLISNEHLLGSNKASQMQLDPGASIGGGVLIGAVFGAIVGAMVGHQNDDKLKIATEAAPTPTPDSAAQSRAPKLF